jgi:L,D-transpeptidase catalytic domain
MVFKNLFPQSLVKCLTGGFSTFAIVCTMTLSHTVAHAQTFAEEEVHEVVPPLTPAEREHLLQFSEPTEDEVQNLDLSADSKIDPNHRVPSNLLKRALAFYKKNRSHIDNPNYLTVVDFSQHSKNSRLFIVNMTSGKVAQLHVAHGSGSDRKDTGYAQHFSNKINSNQSSLGFYRTAETYDGMHGLSLRLDGLSSTNSNVRERSIVIHGAPYVFDKDIKQGRSGGCLAVSEARHLQVVKMLKEGSIIYAGIGSRHSMTDDETTAENDERPNDQTADQADDQAGDQTDDQDE